MTKRATRGHLHGYLVIDKPAGMTSHDVVSRIRRLIGERRVGHAGTLDPAATGVLPIAIGHATRTVEFLSDADKAYLAELTFGVETDSLDTDGAVTQITHPGTMTEATFAALLAPFIGSQMQIPPMHAAIKVDGRPLYERARRGEMIDVAARPITIHAIEIVCWNWPVVELFVRCSKGTYIRALVRDIGQVAAVGAYLSNLVRVQSGPFSLADAWTLPELEAAFTREMWENLAEHPDAAVRQTPAVILNQATRSWWTHGNALPVRTSAPLVRVYAEDGTWLGIGTATEAGDTVRPRKVIVEHEVL